MKKIIIIVLLSTLTSFASLAQSKSYSALKDKFSSSDDVHSFSVGGWICRLVMNWAGEYEFKQAIEDLRHVRIIVIPKEEFERNDVSVNGFKKILKQDAFQELAHVKDHGDDVSIYIREMSNKRNYYFVLVEDNDEVTAIELHGYLNPELLKRHSEIAYKN
jgi:hypothetical protein